MSKSGWLGFLLVMMAAGLAGLVWVRAEGTAPLVAGPESLAVGVAGREVQLSLADAGAGLRGVRADLRYTGGESNLLDERYDGSWLLGGGAGGSAQTIAVRIDPAAQEIPDGRAQLHVVASDWSWRHGFGGNSTELVIPIDIDRKKPRVEILTGLTYVTRGGSGAVAYTVSEPAVRDGVMVGDAFYRGYPHPKDPAIRFALYAIASNAPANPSIQVVAEDGAGNAGRGRWNVVVKERALPEASVTLPESFLEFTVRDLAESNGIDTSDLQEAFRKINTELRRKNEELIRVATAASAETPLWEGAFEQLADSQVTSRFAEQRTYFVAGVNNSQAVHYGYDLASLALAPITAANTGRVVYADELGIYGNCVLVDHGLGLATLYGHLSRIDVAAGDEVSKGQTLGLSGATGLAGGDHLHFAILLGDTYVDPLEWWDPTWVEAHVDPQLADPLP